MDDVKIKFYGTNYTKDHTMEVYYNISNEIFIEIEGEDGLSWITMNKPTAVQLVKKLKLEISKIKQDG